MGVLAVLDRLFGLLLLSNIFGSRLMSSFLLLFISADLILVYTIIMDLGLEI